MGSGPNHSHWFKEQESIDFAHELRHAGPDDPVVMQLDASVFAGADLAGGPAEQSLRPREHQQDDQQAEQAPGIGAESQFLGHGVLLGAACVRSDGTTGV